MVSTRLVALVAPLVVSACATRYGPIGFTGGYTEVKVADSVHRVAFTGNGMTSARRVGDLALLRCAELTLDSGYSFFEYLDGTLHTSTQQLQLTDDHIVSTTTYDEWSETWSTTHSFVEATYMDVTKYTAAVDVRIGADPDEEGQIMDAVEVMKRLGPAAYKGRRAPYGRVWPNDHPLRLEEWDWRSASEGAIGSAYIVSWGDDASYLRVPAEGMIEVYDRAGRVLERGYRFAPERCPEIRARLLERGRRAIEDGDGLVWRRFGRIVQQFASTEQGCVLSTREPTSVWGLP